MAEILKLAKESEAAAIAKMSEAIRARKVVLYPTETVYGVGGDATSEQVVAKVYHIKGRQNAKPLSIAFSDFSSISSYCELSHSQEETLKQYLPGPYTFILKVKRYLPATPNDRIGVRIPANDFIRAVIARCGRPLITTSANLSGYRDPFSFEDVDKRILEACDLAIDAGPTRYKQPSTVVDLTKNALLRQGAGKWG